MNLDPRHRGELHRSGISDETIDAADIHSAEGATVAGILVELEFRRAR
jgi:hypothetical protein